jgi:hypothetical protein
MGKIPMVAECPPVEKCYRMESVRKIDLFFIRKIRLFFTRLSVIELEDSQVRCSGVSESVQLASIIVLRGLQLKSAQIVIRWRVSEKCPKRLMCPEKWSSDAKCPEESQSAKSKSH